MEKLDEVMRCLNMCYKDDCGNCDYCGHGCSEILMRDALDLLKEYRSCLIGCGIRQYGMEVVK